jgi:hypothetical protein
LRRRPVVAAVVVSIATAPGVRASDACSVALESWVKLSESRIHKQKAGDNPRTALGACIATEGFRRELLGALAAARRTCEASTAPDPAMQQTKALIGINESFVTSLGLCPPEQRPAKPPAAPETARPAAHPRECLEISRVTAERYVFANRRCSGSKVLAIIETRGASGKVECRAHTIDGQATILAPGKVRPQLDYQCPLGQPRCTKEHLAAMFPECDW